MENYIVSARKYRPETFQTVIGQPAITTTLKNAIRTRQLAHAYLFCGPRGIGKTTCARIFAKTINCFHITENTEACNECESCLSFNSSRSYNIHELDGASNNSVDDIRSLIEQVRIPPQIGKYSIYIIDEVHMLSPNAFNAFLKTLEEPPSHAIFILATTEKHKIIPTILSRCQIFDFNRIRMEDIALHLENIALAENIEAERAGLDIISQKADGAMRDALSIFDQIVSFSGGKITYQNVIDNLNVLDYDYFFRLTDSILTGNIPGALMIFNEVLDRGFDGHNFINGLSRHFRDLLVCRDEVTIQLLEVGAALREQYRIQSNSCSHSFILNALDLTNKCDLSFRTSRNQRLHVELCLVQLCSLQTDEKKKSEPSEGLLKQNGASQVSVSPGTGNPAASGAALNKTGGDTTGSNRNTGSAGDENPAGNSNSHSEQQRNAGASRSTQKEDIPVSTMASRMTTGGTTNPQGPSTSSIKGLITKSNRQDPVPEPDDNVDKPEATTGSAGENEKPDDRGRNNSQDQPQVNIGNISEGAGNISEGITGNTAESPPPASQLDIIGSYGINNTLSIKDALKGTLIIKDTDPDDNPQEADDDDDLLVAAEDGDDFTEKELQEQWIKFANQISNRHPRLYNTLLANKPTITSQTSIEFEISNPLQQEALDKLKPELLGHLRRELNRNLELLFVINETIKESRLYQPEDKYEHMVKKNPSLAVFKQKFNLDFD
jgi:DNA polymerase III subunit gamma/tau